MIGDAYVVTGGLTDNAGLDLATAIVKFAFEMREQTTKVASPADINASPEVCITEKYVHMCVYLYSTTQIRIGIHTGKVLTAVTGKKMLHYCLFGETIDTAKIMESSGEPSRIHISKTTYR